MVGEKLTETGGKLSRTPSRTQADGKQWQIQFKLVHVRRPDSDRTLKALW